MPIHNRHHVDRTASVVTYYATTLFRERHVCRVGRRRTISLFHEDEPRGRPVFHEALGGDTGDQFVCLHQLGRMFPCSRHQALRVVSSIPAAAITDCNGTASKGLRSYPGGN